MSDDQLTDLLDRYLKKDTSISENELLEKWLSEYNLAGDKLQQLNAEERTLWLDDLFVDLKTSINTAPKIVSLKPKSSLKIMLAVAAMLLLCLGLAWTLPMILAKYAQIGLQTLEAASKQQKDITLSDGSKISLNSGSKISYPKNFDGSTRDVYLDGEAYFDVKHDPGKPFVVHTGKVNTIVLGTAFDIKASDESSVIVTVSRGKVSVSDGKRLIGYVTPGRQINYDMASQKHNEKGVDVVQVLSWQDPDIHFNDTTLADAIDDLQMRFNLHINFADEKLKSYRFTGTIQKSKSIDEILKIICIYINVTYQYNPDGSITIRQK